MDFTGRDLTEEDWEQLITSTSSYLTAREQQLLYQLGDIVFNSTDLMTDIATFYDQALSIEDWSDQEIAFRGICSIAKSSSEYHYDHSLDPDDNKESYDNKAFIKSSDYC